MNWINNIKSGLSTLLSDSSKLTDRNFEHFWSNGSIQGYNFGQASSKLFIDDAYGCNPFVYNAVEYIADKASQATRKTVDSEGEEVKVDSYNLALENTGAVYDPDRKTVYQKLVINLLVTGNAFLAVKNPVGMPDDIFFEVLLSQNTEINTLNGSESGTVTKYTYTRDDGTPVYYEPDEVLHIKYANVIDQSNWGLSPLRAAILSTETSNNIFEASAHIHKNKGISGIISNQDSNMPMLPTEQEKLQSSFQKMAGGTSKFGQVAITSASLKYLQLAMNPSDLKSLEFNMEMLRTICAVYKLPSQIFNDTAASTYNNMIEAKKAAYTDAIIPVTNYIDGCLTDFIYRFKLKNKDYKIVTDYSNVEALATDKKEQAETIDTKIDSLIKLLDKGLITQEQAVDMTEKILDNEQ